MDMTVAVVDDAFLNEERMDHSAALMCFSPGSTYEGAKVDLSLMPVGRFSLYPIPEGRHFFINKDWRRQTVAHVVLDCILLNLQIMNDLYHILTILCNQAIMNEDNFLVVVQNF